MKWNGRRMGILNGKEFVVLKGRHGIAGQVI